MAKHAKPKCEVETLARQIAKAWLAAEAVDIEASAAAAADKFVSNRPILEICDKIEALEHLLTLGRAKSAAGAMGQIVRINADLGNMLEELELDGEKDRLAQKYERRIARCLYSVLNYLQKESGVDAGEIGADEYMPPWHDSGMEATILIKQRQGTCRSKPQIGA